MERIVYWQDGGGPSEADFPYEDPPAEPPAGLVVDCQIASPANGDTKVGPQNGVTIVVDGTAKITSGTGTLDRVEVQFGGDAPFEQAENTSGSWSAWRKSKLIATSGAVAITARAVVNGQPSTTRTITVITQLTTAPSAEDTTPPQVDITTPKRASSIVITATIPVEIVDVAGTASDVGKGIKQVEVFADGAPVKVVKVGGQWNNWTGRASLVGLGKHTITARATDNAGLASTSSVEITAAAEPATTPAVERLLLVEKLRLSTLLGRYGYGRPIKTLTLLPGEKTTVTVKSYKRTTETATEASSILDETSDESLKEFENQLTAEQSNRRATEESLAWSVSGQASGSWGGLSASIEAGVSGASNAAREELAKNVKNAVQKQSAKASAKRVVDVKTSREMKKEEGEEFASESEIENINVSRTLNFVFSQMNQEFITLLHLVDVRVAYVRGDVVEGESGQEMRWTYREVTLSQLKGLLDQVIVPSKREDVRRAIVAALTNVFDYEDVPHTLIEERELKDRPGNLVDTYFRVPRITSKYKLDGNEVEVPGVILSEMRNVMRTDGVVCEAVLGQGNALDAYSRGLQREAVEARQLENDRQREALNKDRLAIKLVTDGNADGAKIFKDVYPAPESESLALVTTNAMPDGARG